MRGDRGFTLDETLDPFREASAWFLAIVGTVGPDQWTEPGLGEWNVREVAAHASRAYLTIEQYLQPSGHIDVDSVADYFGRAIPGPEVNADIAERGRSEARSLGADPVAEIVARADRAFAVIGQAPVGAVCISRGGTLSLADYLATRVVELTIHSLDLTAALGLDGTDLGEPPEPASRVSLTVLAALAAQPSSGVLLRALTGRVLLPQGYSVFP
jgi:uncharacterized protein (TIGR03083 family)